MGRVGKGDTSFISNEGKNDLIKIVKLLQKSGLLLNNAVKQ